MTDLTSSGASGGLCLTYGVGGEVVVVHISLGIFFIKTVDLLSVAYRAESCNCKNLSLTSCKQTRTVYSGKNAYLGSQRTDIIDSTAVNTLALVEPVSYDLLLELVDALVDHSGLFGIKLIKLSVDIVLDRIEHFLTLVLVICIESNLYSVSSKFLDGIEHIVVNFHGLELELLLADLSLDIADESDQLLDLGVACNDGVEHSVIVNLVSACFDHNDLVLGTCNGKVKVISCSLLESGVKNDLAVNQTNADAADRAVPGNIGN